MTRLGYQIPNFTYPGVVEADIFDHVVAQAKAAEAAGFDRVFVMDHFYQLPGLGAHDEPMFECYTMLSALAQHTESVRLSALVTGNTYRHPTLLAKTITALDHVSGGRATLGIGAGWFELEHNSLGYDFGTFTDRFEKLEESLQILVPLLNGETVTLQGKHYQVTDAVNSPAPISRIPIMIGGSGEKKTLRMVAQYADESNLAGGPIEEIPRKLDALAAHCERLGRDRSEIKVTKLQMVLVAPTMEDVDADLLEVAAAKGWGDEEMQLIKDVLITGDPDTVGERLQAAMNMGLDGITVDLPVNGHKTERIELLGRDRPGRYRRLSRRALGTVALRSVAALTTVRPWNFGCWAQWTSSTTANGSRSGGPSPARSWLSCVANAERPVSTDQLIEGVYGDEATPGSRRSVQTYVSNLRSLLGDMITSAASGYEFRPIDSTIDAAEFVSKLETGRAGIEADPAAASETLRSALALWRGHPYSDIEALGELDAETTRLNELRIVAIESRIEADLAIGRHRELVGELEVLTTEHPLREAFHSQLILALYRSERQAEALRAYSRMREHLAEELGVDPSPALRQLEQRILQQDPGLLLDREATIRRRAVLAIDLSTAALESVDDPGQRARTLDEVDGLIAGSVAELGGEVADQRGTTTFCTFAEVRDAVDAAVTVATSAPRTNNLPVVRMGLDIVDTEDGHGGSDGIVMSNATGLVAAAHPGQVLVGPRARASVDDDGNLTLQPLGEYRLGRSEKPATVHQLTVDGLPSSFPDLVIGPDLPVAPVGTVDAPGYELRDEIGRGRIGAVYRAYQPSVGREVAVKVIRPELANSPSFIRRFVGRGPDGRPHRASERRPPL